MFGQNLSGYARLLASLASGVLLAGAAGSCDSVATGPGGPDPPGIAFETRFPAALVAAGPRAAAQLIPFDRVRIQFQRLTGASALDTTLATSPDADSLAVTLSVPLALSVPILGETMTLVITCINDQGTAVYRGGPVVVLVRPGRAPSPVVIQLAYVGTGALASAIHIAPNTLSVLLGQPFAFTATVLDQSGNPIPGAPVVWSVLEPTLARLTSPLAGAGTALTSTGLAHIVAQVPDGPADTVTLTIQPITDVTRILQLVSGGAQSGFVGALLGLPVVVRLVNATGNAVTGIQVTFSPSNGGTVGSQSVNTDANGRAQTSWTLGSLVGTQTLGVSAAGLTSSSLSVSATGLPLSAPVATALQFAASLADGVAGTVLGTVSVRALDAAGSIVTTFTNPITVALGNNPGGATLLGTTTATPVNGVATFRDLSLDRVASGYTLVASAANVTNAASNQFSIAHALASILSIVGGNNQSGTVGLLLAMPLIAKVTDPFDNPVPGIPVAWGVLGGGGVLGNVTSQTNASGLASNTWTLGLFTGLQRLTATVSGLTGSPLTYAATGTPVAPIATSIRISAVQSTAVAGATLSAITASAVDDAGSVVTGFVNTITIALGTNAGGATLSGTRTVRAVNGVATFDDLSLDKAASGYTFVESASGLSSATSDPFSITHAVAAIISIAGGNNQSGLISALLPVPLSVLVTDAFGNAVPSVPVVWSIAAGGGLLGNGTTTTNTSGIATDTWTLGLLGVQRATATVNGLSGSPLTFVATALLGHP